MTATHDITRIHRGRLIKRLGRRSTPIGQKRPLVIISHPQTADVANLSIGQIESTKTQSGLCGFQGLQPLGVEPDEGVLLRDGSRCARGLVPLRAP